MQRRLAWMFGGLLGVVVMTGLQAETPSALTDTQRAVHLLNRFTYGPRPGDVDKVQKTGFDDWMDQQLHPERLPDTMPRQPPLNPDPKKAAGEAGNRLVRNKLWRSVKSERQVQELMVDFWFNHFNVSINKCDRLQVYLYEETAIRPHCMGRFRDLLGAVAHSPAMMFYLDNVRSRKDTVKNDVRVPGINENYARELMELHTLGVNGGYTQRDVIEVARCLTGWGLDRHPDGSQEFKFDPKVHDDDAKEVLGVPLPAGGGETDGETVLDILATHPSTARFVATKLCRAMVDDDPSPVLVDEVAHTFLTTRGDIAAMLKTIYGSEAFWNPAVYRAKYKTPLFLVASAMRTLTATPGDPRKVTDALGRMGMPLYQCDPPTGYADRTDAWLSSGGLLERLNFCTDLAQNQVNGVRVNLEPLLTYVAGPNRERDAMYQTTNSLINILIDGPVSNRTLLSLQGAVADPTCDYPHLIALILGSPEFQKR